jgi:photosystem II stability/assembly factor-like uncharacterized protein
MGGVRVLLGTKKGAFILTSNEDRRDWKVQGPLFGGWEVMHLSGSPANPDRIFASQWTDWHGQVIQRSDDGGQTWTPVGNDFSYEGETGTHQWYDGTPHPWEFKRVWHLQPAPGDPNIVYAGVEDAALFRSEDGGENWSELAALRTHSTGETWAPGAGGMCLHTILLDPANPDRIVVAISAAGAFRSDDGGRSWEVATGGLSSSFLPEPEAPIGHCIHKLAMHPSQPDTLFMQKHWHVCRSDDAGRNWRQVGEGLPSDFGFPIVVHPHEPETIYVVPILSDAEHYPPEGKLRVYRSRTGGGSWEALTAGLPQANCYQNVLRDAMAVDTLERCGVYVGTTGGQLFASANEGDEWSVIADSLPRILSVEVQTLP